METTPANQTVLRGFLFLGKKVLDKKIKVWDNTKHKMKQRNKICKKCKGEGFIKVDESNYAIAGDLLVTNKTTVRKLCPVCKRIKEN